MDIGHVHFPAKRSGETKLVYRSRDVRPRDVKVPATFTGESEVCIGHVTSGDVTSIFSVNLAGKLNRRLRDINFSTDLGVGKLDWCMDHVTSGNVT